MKFRFILALVLVLIAAPAFAQKVYIDYDSDYDFDSIKTFAWSDTPETSMELSSPLLHTRLIETLDRYLEEGGFIEDNDNPDIYVTYHTSTEEEMSVNTSNFGVGYPGGWYHGGYYSRYGYGYGASMSVGTSTSTVRKYLVGTLVIDAWDAETDKLVWRGMAANITVSKNPDKMGAKLDKAVGKIVKKGQKIKK